MYCYTYQITLPTHVQYTSCVQGNTMATVYSERLCYPLKSHSNVGTSVNLTCYTLAYLTVLERKNSFYGIRSQHITSPFSRGLMDQESVAMKTKRNPKILLQDITNHLPNNDILICRTLFQFQDKEGKLYICITLIHWNYKCNIKELHNDKMTCNTEEVDMRWEEGNRASGKR